MSIAGVQYMQFCELVCLVHWLNTAFFLLKFGACTQNSVRNLWFLSMCRCLRNWSQHLLKEKFIKKLDCCKWTERAMPHRAQRSGYMKQVDAFNEVDEKLNDHVCKDNINCRCTLHAKSYYGRGIYITVLSRVLYIKNYYDRRNLHHMCLLPLY